MPESLTTPHAGLGSLDFATIALYLIGTFAIALVCAKQRGSTEEFFLGSRRMPWFAVGLSIVATLMSTVSYLAQPGEMIKHGIGIFFAWIAIPFSIFVVLRYWVPFFMRLRLTSAYEYLEHRFNYGARFLAASLFVLLRLGWMGVVVYTSSLALETMVDVTIYKVILTVGVFATIYTTVGGFRAVIWTDVAQFIVLFAGAFITVAYVVYATGSGPLDWWRTAAQANIDYTNPPIFSFDVTVRVTVVTAVLHSFFWTVCTHGSDQVVLQRYFSTPSLGAARRSYILNAVADFSVGILLALCGLALLAFYLKNPGALPEDISPTENADKVFPYFISHQLPAGIAGLIVSALIAAAMSSIDSGVNSVSAVLTTDMFGRLYPKGREVLNSVALARTLTMVVGAIATLLAMLFAYWIREIAGDVNILDLMAKGFNMFLGPLFALFFIGMFIPRAGARTANTSALVGMAVSIAWSYWPELTGSKVVPTFTLAIAVPCVVSILLATILAHLIEPAGAQPETKLTWTAVMRTAPIGEDRDDAESRS